MSVSPSSVAIPLLSDKKPSEIEAWVPQMARKTTMQRDLLALMARARKDLGLGHCAHNGQRKMAPRDSLSYVGGLGRSFIPPIPVPVSQLLRSMNSVGCSSGKSMQNSDSISIILGGHPHTPVPPKPHTLSQSTGAQIVSSARDGRGVVDDRNGYITEAGKRKEKEKEKRKSGRHECWLPSVLAGRIGHQSSLI